MSPYLTQPILTPRERSMKYVEAAFMARENAAGYRQRARQCPEHAQGYQELAHEAFERACDYLHQARVLRIIAARRQVNA